MSDASRRLSDALADRYVVERELGHGGMATVYLARDVRHGREVAIKVLRPDLAAAVGAERFLREIAIAAQLRHPHILPLLESGEAAGQLFYVMPFVDGESLRDRLARDGALPPSEAMRLLRDVVDGLAHAHRHNVVHRDIKPDNVMIAERHAHVVDFGIAKAMRDATSTATLTGLGISIGTPAYMAPEQIAAEPTVDHRADIYAVGVVAYEMLSGRTPFVGTPQSMLFAHVTTAPLALTDVAPDVPPAIARIVMRCLEKDPANRYPTADALLADIESLTTPVPAESAPVVRQRMHRRRLLLGALGVVVAGSAVVFTTGVRRERWLHATALPELRRLVEAGEQDSAFVLAQEIEEVAPGDSTLATLRPRFTRTVMLTTQPAGVTIHRASLADTARWFLVGTTPMDSVGVPRRTGLFRFEKPGYRTVHRLLGMFAAESTFLDPIAAPDSDMVRIAGGQFRPFLVGTDGGEALDLDAFRMDRFEITNRQYRAFVDAGGYRNRAFWEGELRDGDRVLTFDEAMARFVDRTGRPGPATWEGGGYAPGADSMPVGGVSFYEAAAYAKFAGKSLPTLYHWARAASIQFARWVVPLSNLEGAGPLPVGTERGVSGGGVSDLAGNVREWCINPAGADLHFILGGGWSDPKYAFVDAYAMKPMNRAPINGIRLVRYDTSDANLARAMRPILRAFTDFNKEQPVPDGVYAGYRQMFDYDPGPLDAGVEMRDTTRADWILERVSFRTAYGGERMSAWVYLPRGAQQRRQAVVWFPGSNAINGGASDGVADPWAAWVVRSGRVFVLPIYKSTFERSDSLRSDIPDKSIFWRDHVLMWVKDYRRTLDYLATRPDIDAEKFAYFGFSWGGYMGGIIPAVEPRLKASVLYVAGLTMERGRPEVEPFNHLPRVKVPTLMLNGEHDFFFPAQTAQQPFFRVLGPAPAHKKYMVFEGGHDVPRARLIGESLAWFDRYLGPVR